MGGQGGEGGWGMEGQAEGLGFEVEGFLYKLPEGGGRTRRPADQRAR